MEVRDEKDDVGGELALTLALLVLLAVTVVLIANLIGAINVLG